MSIPTLNEIRKAPKVLLHDHLDGGLRSTTIVELAKRNGYGDLPSYDASELARWMHAGADRRSLELYLETFAHTTAVMQTPESIERVAAECAEDLADDGVVYAEVRFAPELLCEEGLTLREATEAALAGFAQGGEARGIRIATLLVGMREGNRWMETASLALSLRDRGVAGFDIAGKEAGYPPSNYEAAFAKLRQECFPYTIHAGEGFGLASIQEAVRICGAERLGHGVRIIDDIRTPEGNSDTGYDAVSLRALRSERAGSAQRPVGDYQLGLLAAYVRDRRIALELCPSSNVHTGAVDSIDTHPIGLLYELGFRVTVNTDNRLMSNTSLSKELKSCADAFNWSLADLRRLSVNAAKSAFLPHTERRALIEEVILPGYCSLGTT